jgi:hypothetical protein
MPQGCLPGSCGCWAEEFLLGTAVACSDQILRECSLVGMHAAASSSGMRWPELGRRSHQHAGLQPPRVQRTVQTCWQV